MNVVKVVEGYTSKWWNKIVMPAILRVFKMVQLNLLKKGNTQTYPRLLSLTEQFVHWLTIGCEY